MYFELNKVHSSLNDKLIKEYQESRIEKLKTIFLQYRLDELNEVARNSSVKFREIDSFEMMSNGSGVNLIVKQIVVELVLMNLDLSNKPLLFKEVISSVHNALIVACFDLNDIEYYAGGIYTQSLIWEFYKSIYIHLLNNGVKNMVGWKGYNMILVEKVKYGFRNNDTN